MSAQDAIHERAAAIAYYAANIGVRVELDGRWQNAYLADLPAAVAIREAFRLLLRSPTTHVLLKHGGYAFPNYCGDCGAALVGGLTEHKPDCWIRQMIAETFGTREERTR